MSLHNKGGRERRDFIRMKIDRPLGAHIKSDGRELEGLCRELSGGGMKVETREPLGPDMEVEVTVSSEYGQGSSLKARARVARVDPTINGSYILGLEILDVLN